MAQAEYQSRLDERRGSASARGYDSAWRRFRDGYLSVHPLCSDCYQRGQYTAASEVHHMHKLADGGERLSESNCMGLCHACHSVRTRRGE